MTSPLSNFSSNSTVPASISEGQQSSRADRDMHSECIWQKSLNVCWEAPFENTWGWVLLFLFLTMYYICFKDAVWIVHTWFTCSLWEVGRFYSYYKCCQLFGIYTDNTASIVIGCVVGCVVLTAVISILQIIRYISFDFRICRVLALKLIGAKWHSLSVFKVVLLMWLIGITHRRSENH